MVEGFELTPSQDRELGKAMKLNQDSVETLVETIKRRYCAMPVPDFLEQLAEFAKCDGDVTQEEATIMHRIALAFGQPEEEWPALSNSLGLNVTDLWSVLGFIARPRSKSLKPLFVTSSSSITPTASPASHRSGATWPQRRQSN